MMLCNAAGQSSCVSSPVVRYALRSASAQSPAVCTKPATGEDLLVRVLTASQVSFQPFGAVASVDVAMGGDVREGSMQEQASHAPGQLLTAISVLPCPCPSLQSSSSPARPDRGASVHVDDTCACVGLFWLAGNPGVRHEYFAGLELKARLDSVR